MLYQLSYASPHRLFPAHTAASPGERPFKRKNSTRARRSQCDPSVQAVYAFETLMWLPSESTSCANIPPKSCLVGGMEKVTPFAAILS